MCVCMCVLCGCGVCIYIYIVHHFILLRLNLVCPRCEFTCQQNVLKTFSGLGYLHSKDGIVWLWHFLLSLDIYNSSFYLATAKSLWLMVIGRDGGLRILCHSCGFACRQRVLKTFSGRSYLSLVDRIVSL